MTKRLNSKESSYELNDYIHAATRENTRRSYRSSIEHFEINWGGLLPTTPDQIARYLAKYAQDLAYNTLKLRLAALSQWHKAQGFPDPTKDPVIKKVLRGIRELHPSQEKQAHPLEINTLRRVSSVLVAAEKNYPSDADKLRSMRDHALILVGFWRGFRADELCRIQIEDITIDKGKGMSFFLQRSKTDQGYGRNYQTPALLELCPVKACSTWIEATGLTEGPLLQKISVKGNLSGRSMNPGSLISIIRQRLSEAAIENVDSYTGHSLRRGFASWANKQGWSQIDLMKYVGWKDPKSAARYIEVNNNFEF